MKLRCALIVALTILIMASTVASIRAAQQPQASVNDPVILSDTHGYDFAPYLNQLTNQVRSKWYSLIPESARLGRMGRVILTFTIPRNGRIQDLRVVDGSGAQALDKAATDAVQTSSPLPELPADFSDSQIVVQFTFRYNMR
jgi:periplasmic protein TonB